ncbi:DUF6086 family protein [Mycobacterium sp. NPDC051198]
MSGSTVGFRVPRFTPSLVGLRQHAEEEADDADHLYKHDQVQNIVVSFIFDVEDTTVWSPALRVGELYVRFVVQVADLLGVPTGLSEMAADYYEIDADVFEAMVKTVFEETFRSAHQVGRPMLESVLAPSVVILDRIDRPLSANTPEEIAFLERARTLSMAR